MALKLFGQALTAQRKPMLETAAIALAFCLGLALDLVLIPGHGGMGAAVAAAVAYSVGGHNWMPARRRADVDTVFCGAFRPEAFERAGRYDEHQYYRYGLNKVAVAVKHRQVVSGRALVPLIFVGSLAALGAAAVPSTLARKALAGEVVVYGACALVFGADAVRRRREQWGLLPRVFAVFPLFHVAHGLGSLHGWLRAARRR